MARPKYYEGEPTAYDRLADAFWELLGEMPYDKITIRALSAKADVNQNTFYYHFDNIDDFASKMIDDTAFYELIPEFLSSKEIFSDLGEQGTPSSEARTRFEKMSMVARNGNARLGASLRDSMIGHWAKAIGRDFEELSDKERFLFNFIMGGIQSAFGSIDSVERIAEVPNYMDSPLIEGAKETLLEMSDTQKELNLTT